MKTLRKSIYLLLTGLFLGISNLSFGHGECNNRNNCDWTINTPWQYKAHARVNKWGWPSSSTDKDCPYYYGDGYAYAYKSNSCAWQYAANNYGSWSFGGAVSKNYCARGNSSSTMFYDIASYTNANDELENSEITTNKVEYGESSVRLSGINAKFFVSGNSLFSSFEVIMWMPLVDLKNNLEDEDITKDKTFWRGKIELYRGQVTLTGDFPKDSYTLTRVKNGYVVTIKDLSIEGKLPAGVNGHKNLIEVKGISDAGVHEEKEVMGILGETASNSAIDFVLSPNPTADLLTIYFKSELPKSDKIEVSLYDKMGNPIKTLYSGIITGGEFKETFNLAEFLKESGMYYVLINQEDKVYLKSLLYKP